METKSNVKHILLAFSIFGMAILFIGCSSSKIGINVARMPESPLSAQVSKLVLVNRVDLATAQTNQYFNGRIVGQYNGISEHMVNVSLHKIAQQLNAGPYYHAVDTNLKYIRKTGRFNSKPIPKAVIQKTCDKLGVDAIIATEAYTADVDTDSEVRYSSPVDRTYGTFQIPYFDGQQNVFMKMLFRAYLCHHAVGEVDSEITVGTQLSIAATGATPYEVSSNLPGSGGVLAESARRIGMDYAQQLSPRWEVQPRKIFTKGNDQMQQAYGYAKIGNWQLAADILYLLATSNNRKLASHATYNLILANEAMGDMELAVEWANLCIDKYDMPEGKIYLEMLTDRKVEIKQLKELFPYILL